MAPWVIQGKLPIRSCSPIFLAGFRVPKDEFYKGLLVALEFVSWDVAKVKSRSNVVWFVNQDIGVLDYCFQIGSQQPLPPLLNFIKDLMEHGPDIAESHGGVANDDCPEVVDDVHIDTLFLLVFEPFEQVAGVINAGEDIV